MLIIGDVHGKVDQYWKILQEHPNEKSICVGDFGFRKEHEWHRENIDGEKHKINFGNHDDTAFLHSLHSCHDSSYFPEYQLMTIRGAYSIDQYHRIEGRDWWRDEEISYKEFNKIIRHYKRVKPKIMLTHDCPQSIRESLFNIYDKTITSNALQVMLEIWQPELWIFGHFHSLRNEIINNTRFICLNELETFTI